MIRSQDSHRGVLSSGVLVLGVALLVGLVWSSASQAQPSTKPFEIVPGSFKIIPSTTQAGAHEDLTTELDFAHNSSGHTFNDPRTVVVNLPAGFTASNTAVPTCTFSQLLSGAPTEVEHAVAKPPHSGVMSQCPPASQVGTITFDLTGLNPAEPVQRDTVPVYNMETTSFGVTAELGFHSAFITSQLLVSVRPGDSGLTVTTPNIEQVGEPHAISVTTWGVPASHVHDAERGLECLPNGGGGRKNPNGGAECFNGGEEVTIPVRPFLSNPTSCGTFTASMKAESWEEPQPDGWLAMPVEAGRLGAFSEVGPIGGMRSRSVRPVD
jgi:hypothetical protein